jgi:hypothetical protein
MQLKAYWISQFLIDYLKMGLLLGTSLLTYYLFENYGYIDYYVVALAYPFGALPYLYVLSFAF